MATPLTIRVTGLSTRISRALLIQSKEWRCRSLFSTSSDKPPSQSDDEKSERREKTNETTEQKDKNIKDSWKESTYLERCRTLFTSSNKQQVEKAEQTNKTTEQTDQKTDQTDQKTEQPDTSAKDEEIAAQTAQIKKMDEDLQSSKDKYMRSLAECENLRRRMVKQVDDAKRFGIQGFCKDLLEVSDILGTAIKSTPEEQLEKDTNPHLVDLFQGLNMTETNLLKVFKKHGLVQISPEEGEKFDPNFHEALFNVPVQTPTQEGDTVAVVTQIGFQLHSRTIRPAKVGVFKS